jgi:protocatechuate 3,4-dioxygenase beta subunit
VLSASFEILLTRFVPDVAVEARSPSMPGVAAVLSDRDGAYRFPSLQPGVYELTATRAVFTRVTMPGIVVVLGLRSRSTSRSWSRS